MLPSYTAPYEQRGDVECFVKSQAYTEAFGLQWNRYSDIQFDSRTGSQVTAERLKRCLGTELWAQLKGLTVLEAGCGSGRFTEILLREGAEVQSVDLSSAVDANAKFFPRSSQHRIAQADILSLPLPAQSFDLVLCLGVVQHTPSPEETLDALASHVKPGGYLVIDHYTHNLSYYTKLAPLFRFFLRRMKPEHSMVATEALVKIFFPLHYRVRHWRLAQMLLSRISPVLTYFQTFSELSLEDHRRFALLDTHDSLTDYYKHFRTSLQIERCLRSLNLEVERCEKAGNGVEARARKGL